MVLLTHLADETIALNLLEKALTSACSAVSCDTETNGKDVRDSRGYAQGVSIAYDDTALYLPFRHRSLPEQNYDLHRFKYLLQELISTKTVIYHNAKFDIVSLRTLGINALGKQFVDTMILAHLIDESRPFQGKGLDACVKYYDAGEGKKESDMYKEAVRVLGYENLTAQLTCEYAMNDAWITLNLYRKLVPLLNKEGLGNMWQHKMKFIELLISMEDRGVRVDTDLCELMARLGHHEMAKLRLSLKMLNPMSTTDLKILLIDQLELPIVKETPTGRPCFDKKAMEVYEQILERSENSTAQKVLAYRGWQKSTSSNYEPYVTLLSPDGSLRCNYVLHGTSTGRMSCRSPNLQQVPRSGTKPWNGKMKQCFIPREGYVLIEGDFSQLEFRLASAFAKEQVLLDAFNDPDRDVFQEVADKLGRSRYEAKTLTYSILYGAGARRVSNVFGVSLSEGRRIRDDFFNTYSSLRRASSYAGAYLQAKRKIPLWSGRSLHYINIKDDAHKAFNNMVQGSAADIVERTMIRAASQGLNSIDCRLLLQIHDSCVWEVREDKLAEYVPAIKECMEAVEPDFGVWFKASVHFWGDDKDIDVQSIRSGMVLEPHRNLINS